MDQSITFRLLTGASAPIGHVQAIEALAALSGAVQRSLAGAHTAPDIALLTAFSARAMDVISDLAAAALTPTEAPRAITGEDVSRVLHLYAAVNLPSDGMTTPLFSALSVRTFANSAECCADLATDANSPAHVADARDRPAHAWETDEEHAAAHLLDLLAGRVADQDLRAAEAIGENANDPAFVKAFVSGARALAIDLLMKRAPTIPPPGESSERACSSSPKVGAA